MPATMGALLPRLLGLEEAGRYCGVSAWTLKEWLRSGIVRRVPMPARVLRVDRLDLDRLIETWKDGGRASADASTAESAETLGAGKRPRP
jgi:hypothetical protein